MRGSANAVPKYNDKTFQTGIKMPEINHKALDKSRGIHTRKSAEPRAHGNSAETGARPGGRHSFPGTANSKLCSGSTTLVAAQVCLTHPHCSLTWTDVTRDAGAHAACWPALVCSCTHMCMQVCVHHGATCAHHHSLTSYNETREKPGAERVDQ